MTKSTFLRIVMKYIFIPFLFLVWVPGILAQELTFFERTNQFMSEHITDGQVNYAQMDQVALNILMQEIAKTDHTQMTGNERKAYLINAYNLAVLYSVQMHYPVASVQDVPNFFDTKNLEVNGERISLNELEKEILFPAFPDPRLHFVLVCGAIGCPPIINAAYLPETLEAQLDEQTSKALNRAAFIDLKEGDLYWSSLFDWYASDFGGNKVERIEWINRFRSEALTTDLKTKVLPYDWILNEKKETVSGIADQSANNAIRYVVSSTIPKGTTETKIFNNLYTQATGDGSTLLDRSNFFTTFITSLYGVSDRLNVGLEARYRRVSNTRFGTSLLDVFSTNERTGFRDGFTTIGPKIRWAPVPKWGNFSIQSAFWFPLRDDLEGTDALPYMDWNGATSWTQIFNDFSLGNSFSLFTEVDVLLEDIGSDEDDLNRLSTPVTVIASYFPEPNTTLYVLNGFSPYWKPDLDYFYQAGVGGKYQFSRKFEVELLYTYFTNSFLLENNGRASTFNFGIRINT